MMRKLLFILALSVCFTEKSNSQSYCTPTGDDAFDWISHVGVSSINRYSDQDNGYVLSNQTTLLTIGAYYYLYVDGDYWNFSMYPAYIPPPDLADPMIPVTINAWCDFNRNNTFEASEKIAYWITSSGSEQWFVFQVPPTASLGETRLRVSLGRGVVTDPCEYLIGEAEDFNVTISNYCSSNGGSTGDEWLDYFSLANVSRTSGQEAGGYANTNLTAELAKGQTYELKYSLGFRSGYSYTDAIKAWIDFNNDGDFFDSGEEVLNTITNSTAIMTSSLLVPPNTPNGVTRMRIAVSYNPVFSSCGTFTWGETEDYLISINDCLNPSALNALPTNTSCVLSWTPGAQAAEYEVKHRPVGGNWTVDSSITTNSIVVSGLSEGTVYEWAVRSVCGNGTYKTFAAGTNFTTSCTPPANLTASSVTYSSAVLSWDSLPNAQSYAIRYRPTGTSTWTNVINITDTFAVVSFTNWGGSYEWQVGNKCSDNQLTYSSSSSLTLSCPPVPDGLSGNNGASYADLTWNTSGGNSFTLKYKTASGQNWITINNVTSPYKIFGLYSSTAYQWQVSRSCSAEFSPVSTFTTYCQPTVPSGNPYLDYVSLNGLSRSSGSDGGYASIGTTIPSLTKGSYYTFQFSGGWSGLYANTIYFSARIDFNKNSVFEGGEEVFTEWASGTGAFRSGTFSKQIYIPPGAATGKTLMRVGVRFDYYPTPGCGWSGNGEIEEYVVNIVSPGQKMGAGGDEMDDLKEITVDGASENFNVFPNPATSRITIDYASETSQKRYVTVVNSLGQVLINEKADAFPYVINTESLTNGIYFVNISEGEKATLSRKLIINK